MNEELKPCPFCGSGAVLFERGTAKAVRCSNTKCGVRMIAYQDNYDPIVAWNRRADRDAVPSAHAASVAAGISDMPDDEDKHGRTPGDYFRMGYRAARADRAEAS